MVYKFSNHLKYETNVISAPGEYVKLSIEPQIVFCEKACSFSFICTLFVCPSKFLSSCWVWSRISSIFGCLISIWFWISSRAFLYIQLELIHFFLLLNLFLFYSFVLFMLKLKKIEVGWYKLLHVFLCIF